MDDLLDSEREKAQEDGYNEGYDDRADEEIMNGQRCEGLSAET